MDIFLAILTSSAVGAVVTKILTLIDNKSRAKKVDRIVLLFIIKNLALDALYNQYISAEDLASLEEAYTEYKALGGNGYADTLITRTRELPLREGVEHEVRPKFR